MTTKKIIRAHWDSLGFVTPCDPGDWPEFAGAESLEVVVIIRDPETGAVGGIEPWMGMARDSMPMDIWSGLRREHFRVVPDGYPDFTEWLRLKTAVVLRDILRAHPGEDKTDG